MKKVLGTILISVTIVTMLITLIVDNYYYRKSLSWYDYYGEGAFAENVVKHPYREIKLIYVDRGMVSDSIDMLSNKPFIQITKQKCIKYKSNVDSLLESGEDKCYYLVRCVRWGDTPDPNYSVSGLYYYDVGILDIPLVGVEDQRGVLWPAVVQIEECNLSSMYLRLPTLVTSRK